MHEEILKFSARSKAKSFDIFQLNSIKVLIEKSTFSEDFFPSFLLCACIEIDRVRLMELKNYFRFLISIGLIEREIFYSSFP